MQKVKLLDQARSVLRLKQMSVPPESTVRFSEGMGCLNPSLFKTLLPDFIEKPVGPDKVGPRLALE